MQIGEVDGLGRLNVPATTDPCMIQRMQGQEGDSTDRGGPVWFGTGWGQSNLLKGLRNEVCVDGRLGISGDH